MGRILVTGGAGFTGSHFVDLAHKNGMEVVVLDDFSIGKRSNIPDNVGVIECDIREALPLDLQVDYIVHFAAQGHVDESIKNPMKTVLTNVVGTLNVLEFARKQKHLKRFIHISTDEVFGESRGEEFHEYSRYNCTNPYSASKAGAEELVSSYFYTHGLPVYITHCSNIFGERQQDGALIPICINNALKGKPMTIHTNQGVIPKRKFVYVGDVVRAIYDLLYVNTNCIGNVQKFNIVGEQEFSIFELCGLIYERVGTEFGYTLSDTERPYTDTRYLLSNNRLRSYVDWEPNHTFESKLDDLISYYRTDE